MFNVPVADGYTVDVEDAEIDGVTHTYTLEKRFSDLDGEHRWFVTRIVSYDFAESVDGPFTEAYRRTTPTEALRQAGIDNLVRL